MPVERVERKHPAGAGRGAPRRLRCSSTPLTSTAAAPAGAASAADDLGERHAVPLGDAHQAEVVGIGVARALDEMRAHRPRLRCASDIQTASGQLPRTSLERRVARRCGERLSAVGVTSRSGCNVRQVGEAARVESRAAENLAEGRGAGRVAVERDDRRSSSPSGRGIARLPAQQGVDDGAWSRRANATPPQRQSALEERAPLHDESVGHQAPPPRQPTFALKSRT